MDLAKGLVSLDENKTDRPRSWVLNPGVVRVLERWKKITAAKKGDLVFPDIAWDKLAPSYRAHSFASAHSTCVRSSPRPACSPGRTRFC
jgi:hypothetical protein